MRFAHWRLTSLRTGVYRKLRARVGSLIMHLLDGSITCQLLVRSDRVIVAVSFLFLFFFSFHYFTAHLEAGLISKRLLRSFNKNG
ncbi:hypothetical protein ACOSQ4_006969 [Xanthoceras sorbifolium]